MGAIHPVSRRKPCPNGLNCPPAFNLTRGNSNTRHAGGYSSRRPRAAGALVRLALRPPCLPHERRQPYAVRLAALALCAGAPVLPDFRPFGALLSCGWYVVPARPRSRLVGRFFVPCFIWIYTSRAARLVAALWGVALPRPSISAGGCLACLVRVCRACSYQHTNGGGRINIRRRGDVARHNNAAAVLASVVRCRGILAPFPLLVLVLVR